MAIEVRPATPADQPYLRRSLTDVFHGPVVAVTTNDNVNALRFYQRHGYDLVAVHRDAVTRARALKPAIPEVLDGIPVRHELELELLL